MTHCRVNVRNSLPQEAVGAESVDGLEKGLNTFKEDMPGGSYRTGP